MFCIICTACLLQAQTIKQAEYFIDKDKGAGKNTKLNLTASADSSYQINVDVSGISVGFHKLYIRVKDSKEKWSLTTERAIEITGSFNQQKIITGEYFFDRDLGYGRGDKITVSTPDSAIAKNFAAVTSSLKNGYHKLYVRFKDDNGNWSTTLRKNVEIIRTADTIKIVAVQYFFSDNGFGKATTKAVADSLPDGKFKFKIPFNKIPDNADTVFVRVEDSLGHWSLTRLAKFSIQSLTNTVIASQQNSAVDNNTKEFSVFPNPATQKININFQSKNATATMQIFDVNGKIVLQKTIEPSTLKSIDISKLAAGAYLIKVNDGEVERSAKFIRQ